MTKTLQAPFARFAIIAAAAAMAVGIAGTADAAPHRRGKIKQRDHRVYKPINAKPEVRRHRGANKYRATRAQFAELDLNGNGVITRREMRRTVRANQRYRMSRRQIAARSATRFAKFDLNRNGIITKREFFTAKGVAFRDRGHARPVITRPVYARPAAPTYRANLFASGSWFWF